MARISSYGSSARAGVSDAPAARARFSAAVTPSWIGSAGRPNGPDLARRHGGSRAGAGATRRPFRIPGIARDRRVADGELRRQGLADDDRTGRPQRRDDAGVPLGDPLSEGTEARHGR